jgi:hypothetical protein
MSCITWSHLAKLLRPGIRAILYPNYLEEILFNKTDKPQISLLLIQQYSPHWEKNYNKLLKN